MDFISQYCLYNSGNMSPQRYHRWCAVSILSMAAARKVYVDYDYFLVYSTLYVCLVGRQGIRKSTAMRNAAKMFKKVFPNYPIGASVMSREKIVERMSSQDYERTFLKPDGKPLTYRPLAFFVNEFKNFLSINPGAMIEFLTDIYDEEKFDADTIKHGLQPIENPSISILACETPKWLIEKLKLNIIAGGFSRRMNYVYEVVRPPRKAFPKMTLEMIQAYDWCVKHLEKVGKAIGQFTWDSQQTKDFFEKWFVDLKTPDDEVLEGYYEAKDIIVIKIAMALALAEEEIKLVFTRPLIELAIAFVEENEEHLPKLSMAAGRNELALPTQGLLQMLESNDGWMPEKTLKVRMEKDLNSMEMFNIFRQLKDTDRIHVESVEFPNNVIRVMVMTHEKYNQWIKEKKLQEKK